MPRFCTDWKKIGQSGPTIDGRTISPEWLTQAADSYDPTVYTANIWVEHRRYYGAYGQVRELKAETEGNVTSLYARLMPNALLMDINRQEQKLFTSMELDPDFAGTGKCYLVGLGVTDEPASLGTHELMFSRRKQQDRNLIVCGVEMAPLQDDDTRGGLGRLVDEMTRLFKRLSPDTQPDEEDPMDAKQFTEMMDALNANGKAVSDLAEKFAAFSADPPAAPAEPTEPSEPAGPPADGGDRFTALTDAVNGVVEKLAALEKRMETAAPGTATPETTTPADGDDALY